MEISGAAMPNLPKRNREVTTEYLLFRTDWNVAPTSTWGCTPSHEEQHRNAINATMSLIALGEAENRANKAAVEANSAKSTVATLRAEVLRANERAEHAERQSKLAIDAVDRLVNLLGEMSERISHNTPRRKNLLDDIFGELDNDESVATSVLDGDHMAALMRPIDL